MLERSVHSTGRFRKRALLSSSQSAPAAACPKTMSVAHHTRESNSSKTSARAHNTRPPRARRLIRRAGAGDSRQAETRGRGTQESVRELYCATPNMPKSLSCSCKGMRMSSSFRYARSPREKLCGSSTSALPAGSSDVKFIRNANEPSAALTALRQMRRPIAHVSAARSNIMHVTSSALAAGSLATIVFSSSPSYSPTGAASAAGGAACFGTSMGDFMPAGKSAAWASSLSLACFAWNESACAVTSCLGFSARKEAASRATCAAGALLPTAAPASSRCAPTKPACFGFLAEHSASSLPSRIAFST
mmetsp:Transcript_1171/g.1556  ORF Transcript_1171/g.1556 Transcript_1171/m.1556 type:complete len:305 (+) Transcript_1171:349-1263(+)